MYSSLDNSAQTQAQNKETSLQDAITSSTQVKYSECPLEVKVARLHAEVMSLRLTNNYLSRSVEELRTKVHNLFSHNHVDGDVVIKFKDIQNPYLNGSPSLAESSFDYLK